MKLLIKYIGIRSLCFPEKYFGEGDSLAKMLKVRARWNLRILHSLTGMWGCDLPQLVILLTHQLLASHPSQTVSFFVFATFLRFFPSARTENWNFRGFGQGFGFLIRFVSVFAELLEPDPDPLVQMFLDLEKSNLKVPEKFLFPFFMTCRQQRFVHQFSNSNVKNKNKIQKCWSKT